MPEGRSVSNGFAALTGYTLGLAKALTGVFIYDVITANITDSESDANIGTAQHVCFNTRSLDEDGGRVGWKGRKVRRGRRLDYLDYNPYEDVDVYANLGRQTETAEEEEAAEEAAVDEEVEEAIEEDIDAGVATATDGDGDTATDADTDTDTDTDTNTDTDTDTDTDATTTTSDENGQTCLILYGNR